MNERDPIEHAKRAGPLARGSYRSVVYEADARVTLRDHASLELAILYANDAASETEAGSVLSWVLDDGFRVVHTGKHYATGAAGGSGARNRT